MTTDQSLVEWEGFRAFICFFIKTLSLSLSLSPQKSNQLCEESHRDAERETEKRALVSASARVCAFSHRRRRIKKMEAIAEGVNSLTIADYSAKTAIVKTNRIQVSNTKKPLFFYVNLAKVRLFPLLYLRCSFRYHLYRCVLVFGLSKDCEFWFSEELNGLIFLYPIGHCWSLRLRVCVLATMRSKELAFFIKYSNCMS